MAQSTDESHGASPLPKGNRKPGAPLFKEPDKKNEEKKDRDLTGQTDTSLKHMKQRLKEVPKRSAGSEHDKAAYDRKNKRKSMH